MLFVLGPMSGYRHTWASKIFKFFKCKGAIFSKNRFLLHFYVEFFRKFHFLAKNSGISPLLFINSGKNSGKIAGR